MLRILPLLAALIGCAGPPPALPPPAPLATTPWPGVTVEWHVQLSQAALNEYALRTPTPPHDVQGAAWMRPGGVCEVHLLLDVVRVAEVAAHEAGHCHAIATHGDWSEAPAVAYAAQYVSACGASVAPLGLPDDRPATCDRPPDPAFTAPP